MPNNIITPDKGILFMKVGVHDGEEFGSILERKRREIDRVGYSFWGYGGGTCHPTSQVQPFAKIKRQEGTGLYLVMEEITSNHPHTGNIAREYSEDGINWRPIPDGINVTGSRYAVVLGELEEGDLDIDISHYQVAYGPSRGKNGSHYIKGRVDKACLSYSSDVVVRDSQETCIKKISHYGKIVNPFAVFVRN